MANSLWPRWRKDSAAHSVLTTQDIKLQGPCSEKLRSQVDQSFGGQHPALLRAPPWLRPAEHENGSVMAWDGSGASRSLLEGLSKASPLLNRDKSSSGAIKYSADHSEPPHISCPHLKKKRPTMRWRRCQPGQARQARSQRELPRSRCKLPPASPTVRARGCLPLRDPDKSLGEASTFMASVERCAGFGMLTESVHKASP